MFGRVRRGWGLTKKAWAVIRSRPGLAKLPLTGGALALVAFAVLGIPGALLVGSDSTGAVIGGIVVPGWQHRSVRPRSGVGGHIRRLTS